MPLQATSGAASYDAFGGGVPVEPVYIEQIFSTYLYTGNGSTQTITNGINTSANGGLVWIKSRTTLDEHALFDTTRGTSTVLSTNSSAQAQTETAFTAFTTTGFSLSGAGYQVNINQNTKTYASWTFQKQAKFFDVVTYTGNGTNRTIAHNLGSVPGCIIVKCTSTTSDWITYHRSVGNTQVLKLNTTAAAGTDATAWNSTTPTSTVFSLGTGPTNNAGETYVAYIYAHDAGGFGLAGTDNVISCGTYTGTGTAGLVVTLGYEPQWVLIKKTSSFGDWWLVDNMRGMPVGSANAYLYPNSTAAESTATVISPTATGFTVDAVSAALNGTGATYIYIAIRRGPMKVPTVGTTVYNADTTITATTPAAVSGFVTDLMISTNRTNKATYNEMFWSNRLTANGYMSTTNTTAEQAGGAFGAWDTMNGSGTTALQSAGVSDMAWMFRRAPSFFDEVCYAGDGTAGQNITHNLGVAPELIIVKGRNSTLYWAVQVPALGSGNGLALNLTNALFANGALWNSTAPTSSVFTVGTSTVTGNFGSTYVAYLFATCAGVSKVGSYTGNGSTQTIDCGFTGGARFVLIKRTDSTGDWYTYDTARGMTTLTDPYLLLNSTAAETATLGSVTTVSTGFALNSAILAAINVNAGTYIFLAIA